MAPTTADTDNEAASLALIARLIAEGLCAGRIGSSVEDYEEPLSSYERGLIEDLENVNHGVEGGGMWGGGEGGGSGDGGGTGVIGGEVIGGTGEGWDAGVAEGFVDEMQEGSDRGRFCLGRGVSVPGVGQCRSVGGSRDVLDLEAVEMDVACLPAQADSPERKEDIDDAAGTSGTNTLVKSRLMDEEEIGRAIVGPESTHSKSMENTVQWDDYNPPHRPSAFDRYTGLDVNFSYRNGKNKVGAFDDPTVYEPTGADYNKIYETLFKNSRTKDLGRRRNENKEFCSPWIHIPYLGRRGGGFAEFDAKSEDTEVVEIRLDDDYSFFENKPDDIANNQSPNGNDKAHLWSTETSNEQRDSDQESTCKYEDAPGKSWAKERAWAKHDRGLFQTSEDQELMNKQLEQPSDEVHVEKHVGVQQENPDEKHKHRTLRSKKSLAISRWVEGQPLEPGDTTILNAKPQHWRRAWGYEKDVAYDGASRQMPEKMEEANQWNESLRQVVDDSYKADDEAECSSKGSKEQGEHEPRIERKRVRGRSSTSEECVMAQKRVAAGDETQRGRALF